MNAGDPDDKLDFVVFIDALRQVAARLLQKERIEHTLQPTALVNELFLRYGKQDLANGVPNDEESIKQFIARAERWMTHILVDHSRMHNANKRGGGLSRLSLEYIEPGRAPDTGTLADLQSALTEFERLDSRAHRVVQLKYFWGFTIEEIAAALDVSRSTVEKDWTFARSWLHAFLSEGGFEAKSKE